MAITVRMVNTGDERSRDGRSRLKVKGDGRSDVRMDTYVNGINMCNYECQPRFDGSNCQNGKYKG